MLKKLGWLFVLLTGGLAVYILLFRSDGSFPVDKQSEYLYCGAEQVKDDFFRNGKLSFANGNTQSKEKAYRGEFSSKLDQHHLYGMGIELAGLKSGDVIEASCWVYGANGKPVLNAGGQGGYEFYMNDSWTFDNIQGTSQSNKNDDWYQVRLKFLITGDIEDVTVRIYTAKPDSIDVVYVDDLTIRKYDVDSLYTYDKIDTTLAHLHFEIDSVDFQDIKESRKAAFKTGIIINDGNWAAAKMTFDSARAEVKMRLKGDLPDHLEKSKWSMRIKSKGNELFNRWEVFSIQAPHTKHFLEEWVVHKMMEQEDVLTPRYDFANVSINGNSFGVYAVEEHFTKQLIEYKGRREGPLVRFNEDELWEARLQNDGKDYPNIPLMMASVITAFNDKKIKKDPNMAGYFQIAKNLMHQYRHGLRKPADIFNLDKMARYYVLSDMVRATHGRVWHNQRFYYDPVIGKLEPIFFDGYMSIGEKDANQPSILEASERRKYLYNLLSDTEFKSLVSKYVKRYTSVEWLDAFYDKNQQQLEKLEKILQREYPNYQYSKNFVYSKANELRSQLDDSYTKIQDNTLAKISNLDKEPNEILESISVIAYAVSKDSSGTQLVVQNFHNQEVEVVGTGDEKILQKLREKIRLEAYKGAGLPDSKEVKFIKSGERLFFEVEGEKYSTKIFETTPPVDYSPVQDMNNYEITNESVEGVIVDDSAVIFNKGSFEIDKHLVIPSHKKLVIRPGASIDITSGAAFISYGPVEILGTQGLPVSIRSSDRSARGFTVLQPQGECTFQNVTFANLKPLEYKGWILTGCVSVYEADITLNGVNIIDTDGEDALNLIRCNFSMMNCAIKGTKSDAFDGDFCTGEVKNSEFHHLGNDALDFSGSKIAISGVRVYSAGDKAISSGEQSMLDIENVKVFKSKLGIASKDLSIVKVRDISLTDVKIGFLAYQKKEEYGPARISVSGAKLNKVDKKFTVAQKSVLVMDGKVIEGKDYIPSDLF